MLREARRPARHAAGRAEEALLPGERVAAQSGDERPLPLPEVVPFLAAGRGDRSYLVVAGGAAVMIDPQRHVEPYLEAAEERGARISHVFETHVHNDYLSGGLELARRSGATLVLPHGSRAAFGHRAVRDDEVVETSAIRVRALHTPGHTPEHTSYLVETGADAALLFSGGSLLQGSAGRTDLAGASWTDRLTAAQFASVRRLAALAPDTLLHPTHGGGSFCTASAPAGSGVSTIGDERRANGALADADLLAFSRRQLHGLLRYPAYYPHMAPINRAGPAPLGTVPEPAPLSPAQVASLLAAGVPLVDGRSRAAFAARHVPDSLNVELDDAFGTYVGWLLPFDSPLALMLDRGQDAAEAVRQLAAIGFDRVRGVLWGTDAWAAEGRETRSFARATPEDLAAALRTARPPALLDVRQPAEWDEGVVPGSQLRFVADLADPAARPPGDGPLWIACRSGHRAAIAASILAGAGYEVTAVDGGGVPEILRALAADGR